MVRRRLVRPLGSLFLALALLASAALPVAAGGDTARHPRPVYPELNGPGVISFDVSSMPPLTNAHRQIVQGVPAGGGCRYVDREDHVRPVPGAPITVTRELALDPVTCRYLVDKGSLNNPGAAGASGGASTNRLGGLQPKRADSAGPMLAGYQYGYEYNVEWYDPYNVKVSYADPYVGWNSNGSTVYNCAGNTNTWWFTTSGWWEKSKNISITYVSNTTGCSSEGDVVHENNVFCTKITTDIYYQPVQIIGWWDGTVTTNTATWDGGGCYDWLHWQKTSAYAI